jgi:hypothetical protein
LNNFSETVLGLADVAINRVLVLEHEWSKHSVVDQIGSTVLARYHGPDQEQTLGQRIEWYPEEKLIAEKLQNTE